jgi:hypothetical protein
MTRAIALFCAANVVAVVSACNPSGAEGPDIVRVAEELSTQAHYDVDLTREDAVFYLAPGLDTARLTIICPSRSAMTFADYVNLRISPTGVRYRMELDELWLANDAVPRPLVPGQSQSALASSSQGLAASRCTVTCTDPADEPETCGIVCANQAN